MKVAREFNVRVVQVWEVAREQPSSFDPWSTEEFNAWVMATGVKLSEHEHDLDNDDLTLRVMTEDEFS